MYERRLSREDSMKRCERLKDEGRWKEFCHRREIRTKLLGMRPKDADRITNEEFNRPLEPTEVWTPLPDIEVGLPQVAPISPLPKPAEPRRSIPTPSQAGASNSISGSVSEEVKQTQHRVARIKQSIDPAMFAGKTSNPLKDIMWVAENLAYDSDKVDLTSAPSAAAAYMWMNCKDRSTGFEQTFWKDLYPKIVPSKAAVEDAFRKHVDDGSVEESLINAIEGIAKKIREGEDPALRDSFAEILEHEDRPTGAVDVAEVSAYS